MAPILMKDILLRAQRHPERAATYLHPQTKSTSVIGSNIAATGLDPVSLTIPMNGAYSPMKMAYIRGPQTLISRHISNRMAGGPF